MHKSSHDYRLIVRYFIFQYFLSTENVTIMFAFQRNDFPLFDNQWSVQDETILLDAIQQCGFGNWYAAGHKPVHGR